MFFGFVFIALDYEDEVTTLKNKLCSKSLNIKEYSWRISLCLGASVLINSTLPFDFTFTQLVYKVEAPLVIAYSVLIARINLQVWFELFKKSKKYVSVLGTPMTNWQGSLNAVLVDGHMMLLDV